MRAIRVLLCRVDHRYADHTTVRATFELPTPEPTTLPPTPARDDLEPTTHETGNAMLRQVLHAPSARLILGRTYQHGADRGCSVSRWRT